MLNPLVSIIIPVYNQEAYVEEAINSTLAQTYENIEVLVVDDGSTDGTYGLLTGYLSNPKITILTHRGHKNHGVSRSRKLAINKAKGKYISFLDSDDIFLPDKIETQISHMEQNNDVVLCHGFFDEFSEKKHKSISFAHAYISDKVIKYDRLARPNFLKQNGICNSTVIVKTEAIKDIHFDFNQAFQFEDWLTWTLIAEKGPFLFLPDKLTKYRYHPDSATYQLDKNRLLVYYSRIEFYICLFSKTKRVGVKIKCIKELLLTIVRLYRSY